MLYRMSSDSAPISAPARMAEAAQRQNRNCGTGATSGWYRSHVALVKGIVSPNDLNTVVAGFL